ncbi:MAG: tRNA (N6-threonylcarbamoyladenosine(37)-N6)-methyltransferase TrmO [Acidimicrobiia bacterium]|nr:tRNA (N6-threonylcarbamoyladenosine(37)-N6)-methyltransferase TrmO [Acidimicrobiia bacterium]
MAAEADRTGGNDSLREIRPIGVVHSPFAVPDGTPVQPASAGEGAHGTIEIFEEFAAGLADLDGFDRVWVISWLHRSGPVRLQVTPFLDSEERGLFATRAPARPNPIGISPIRLVCREGRLLRVADLDLIDGTPVLDLKPYAAAFDSYHEGRQGWLEGRSAGAARADDRFGGGR